MGYTIYFMNSFHFKEGGSKLPRLYRIPIYDFDLRATHARTLLPAALASVSFGFVLVRGLYYFRGKWVVLLIRESIIPLFSPANVER